jgi:hypothetical protein
LTYSKTKSPKERLIPILIEVIKQKYNKDETTTRKSLSGYVENTNRLEWYDPDETELHTLYLEYCRVNQFQFILNEYIILKQMLESRHIPEHFIPIPTLIFYLQFLRFQYNLYMSNPKFAEQTIVYDIKKMVSQNI